MTSASDEFDRAGEFASLAPYVRYLADALRLKDWKFHFEIADAVDAPPASISCVNGRKYAIVALGQGYFDSDAEGRRHLLIHELLHPHLHACRVAVDSAERWLGSSAFGIFKANHDAQIESGIDALAAAFCSLLPTRDEWAEKA